jgi:N-acetylglucosamine malate deacetylase 1
MAVDIVFFGAHPDDVEWGVGGTALLLRGKLSFAIIDLTDGEMGSRGSPDERKVEAAAAADFLGASVREALHLPDCGLVDSPDNRRRIASVVRRHRPRMVLAPFWQDRHPDHAAAGLMVRNSQLYCTLKKSDDANPPHKPSAFLFYPLNNFQQPSFVVDTSEVFEHKLDLVRLHRSQFSKTAQEFGVLAHGVSDYLFGLESRDRYIGSLIGARFGEALVADQAIGLRTLGDLLSLLGGDSSTTRLP